MANSLESYAIPVKNPKLLFEIVMSLGRWSWIVFVLSLGAKYLNFIPLTVFLLNA